MSTSRVLSQRALTELLRGNHNNYISVKVDDEVICQVHRPVATRFSTVWKKILSDKNRGIVTVTFPSYTPAAATADQPTNTNKTPTIPPLPPSPSNRDLLKYIVRWMEFGGADSKCTSIVLYPRQNRAGLERLRDLAELLGIDELVSRVKLDLGTLSPPPPAFCRKCGRTDHPGQECKTCRECGSPRHFVGKCQIAYQKFLEREARRREYAEKKRLRMEREEGWRKRREELQEREERRRKEEMIRTGRMAVGDGGRVIWRWA